MLSPVFQDGKLVRIDFYPTTADRKTIDQLRFVIDNNKPINVIKTFTRLTIRHYIWEPIDNAESRYAEVLNTHLQNNGDLSDPPEECKAIEEQYPHIAEFRQNLLNNTEPAYTPPDITEDFSNLDSDTQKAIKDLLWNAIKHMFEKKQKVFKCSRGWNIDCKFPRDIVSLKSLVDYAEAIGLTDDDYVKFRDADNIVHNVKVSTVRLILKEAGEYIQQLYHRKWELQEALQNATTTEELLAALDW